MTKPIHDPKHGFIRTPSGRSPHETYTWTERPVCPECGSQMSENDRVINGKLVFSWWCNDLRNCRYAQQASDENQRMIAESAAYKSIDYTRYGIPEMFAQSTLDNYQGPDRLKEKLRKCAKNPTDTLITGTTGTGKTHLACALLKLMVDNGNVRVAFEGIPSLILAVQDAYKEDSVNNRPKQIAERLIRHSVLVLDDLGAEKPTEHVLTFLYNIINGRLSSNRPTIITTNSTIAKLTMSHGERLASRLKGYANLSTAGKDHRGER